MMAKNKFGRNFAIALLTLQFCLTFCEFVGAGKSEDFVWRPRSKNIPIGPPRKGRQYLQNFALNGDHRVSAPQLRNKGDLCDFQTSLCAPHNPEMSLNVQKMKRRRILKGSPVTPLILYYPPQPLSEGDIRGPALPMKTGRDYDLVDVMEHLLQEAVENNPWGPKQKKKYGNKRHPIVSYPPGYEDKRFWGEDIDHSIPSMHRQTGNIYYAGNPFYSGSHADIQILKKYAPDGKKVYSKSKYHLNPVVHFEEDEEDYYEEVPYRHHRDDLFSDMDY